MVMTKTTITTIVFSLQQKLINVACLASKVVGEVHQICTRKEWFTVESHKIVKPLTFPLVHNFFLKLIVLNMKTMITTTTNMIFYMMFINIINPIDIHMRRETKSQNV